MPNIIINELYLLAWFVCVYACALFVILFILIPQFDCDDMIAHMKQVQSFTISLTSNSDFYLYSIRIYTGTYSFFARLNNNMAWSESNAQKLRQLRWIFFSDVKVVFNLLANLTTNNSDSWACAKKRCFHKNK